MYCLYLPATFPPEYNLSPSEENPKKELLQNFFNSNLQKLLPTITALASFHLTISPRYRSFQENVFCRRTPSHLQQYHW